MTFVLYSLISAALFYLAGRASITRFLWSRYPKWLEAWALCASCSGAWFGAACGAFGYWKELEFLGLAGRDPVTIVVVTLVMIITTPPLAYIQLVCLESLTPPPDDG